MASKASTSGHHTTRKAGLACVLPRDVEMVIAKWIGNLRCVGVPVSRPMFRMMALECAADLGLSDDEFKASNH